MTDFNDYKPDHLYFVALGGSGEFGKNLNLYRWNGRWLMVDCGIAFNDEAIPGHTLVVPDISYIERQRGKLDGLIITHAHEDHIGAVPYLWERLKCPVYATPFAAAFLRSKIEDNHMAEDIDLTVVEPGDYFDVGPFGCCMVPITHSIPESTMIEITTPVGRVVHTGDWKIDNAPTVGEPADAETYKDIGNDGVLAVLSDSTNATVPGTSGDEARVQDGLTKLFDRLPGRIIATCFASNVGRIKSIAEAATASGREVVLVGRSLWRFNHIARDLGYFDGMEPFLGPRNLKRKAPESLVLICTGSQGETAAALSRMAHKEHPQVEVMRHDHVVFSSRIIPGNEEDIAELKAQLARAGCDVITHGEIPEFIYASGHPCQDEIRQLYGWLKPQMVLPVHGTVRHQEANAALARECGIEKTLIPANGKVICLAPNGPEIVGEVQTGHLVLSQNRR